MRQLVAGFLTGGWTLLLRKYGGHEIHLNFGHDELIEIDSCLCGNESLKSFY